MRDRLAVATPLAGVLLVIVGVIVLWVMSLYPSDSRKDPMVKLVDGMIAVPVGAGCVRTGMVLEDQAERVLVAVEWKTPSRELCGSAVSYLFGSREAAIKYAETLAAELLKWDNNAAETGKIRGENSLVVWSRPLCVEASVEACAKTVVGRVGRVVFQATTYSPADPGFETWWQRYMAYLKATFD